MHRVRAITLDLDDTLWDIESVILRADAKLYERIQEDFPRIARRYDSATIRNMRKRIYDAHPNIAHDVTAILRITFERVLRDCNYDPRHSKILLEHFLELRHQVELFPDVVPALRTLSARYPILAVTNGNADIERLSINKFFTGQVSASSTGVRKPDKRIFEHARQAVGEPSECVLHVGDHPLDDVLAAMSFGFQAVWINRRSDVWEHEREPHGVVTTLLELAEMLNLED